jgi:Sushi repeat (SCR repeat)
VRFFFVAAVVCQYDSLLNIDGAIVIFDDSNQMKPLNRSFSYGAVVIYRCQNGTKLENGYTFSSVTCNEYGQWNTSGDAKTCAGYIIFYADLSKT